MSKEKKTYYAVLVAAIFIAMEIAAIGMLKRSSTLQEIWINKLSHRVLAVTWGSGEKIRGYFNLSKQNAELREENLMLLEQLQEYQSLSDELQSRQALREGKLSGRFRYSTATIVKISRNTQHNYIIIDKGREEGITKNSGIITGNGVVGIIYAVDNHYAYGLTLMNPKISVSARIGHSGIVAPMAWDGLSSKRAVMKDIPLHYDVTPGDTVWTSGFSTIFPPDIPLGVTEGSHLENGASSTVDVELFQDFSALRHVIIVENPEREAIQKLEQQ